MTLSDDETDDRFEDGDETWEHGTPTSKHSKETFVYVDLVRETTLFNLKNV